MLSLGEQLQRTMSLKRRSFDQQAYIPISSEGMLSSNTQCRDEVGIGQEGSNPIDTSNQCRDDDDERLRTVECLRGRLLAERVSSKEAKEVTQVIGKKLEELEKRLNKEIKGRDKAEKRLRHALKKLESLKILDLPESSVGSFSSYSSLANEGFDDKRSSSIKTDNDSMQSSSFEEVKKEKIGLGSENGSWCSIGSEMSHVKDENCQNHVTTNYVSEEEFHADMRKSSASTTSVQDMSEEVIKREENKFTIVPANAETSTEERKNKSEIKENNVHAVLLALRQVREQLQYSIERRSSISSMKELYGH
ncbi:hypothetical protein LUZ63_007479 [Rhynchospora breviuscula]|uniref:Uncharacterized protein n=1 Tax=Rhynchospora breviuscula TaxID=2022672 RepID=A0A9Q0HUF4_9POAL|nr:hypothetical protein LUZ63_007479 [Rhynchospora breviuscula]